MCSVYETVKRSCPILDHRQDYTQPKQLTAIWIFSFLKAICTQAGRYTANNMCGFGLS